MLLEVLPAVCDLPLGFVFPTHPTMSGGDCDCCLQPHKSKDTPRKQTEMLHAELWSLHPVRHHTTCSNHPRAFSPAVLGL